MKRKFKRIASLVLAAVMVFAMAMPVMASEMKNAKPEATVVFDGKYYVGHTYEVYQIFTADIATQTVDGKEQEILSNVKYGKSYGTEGQPVPKEVLDDITNAEEFAQKLKGPDGGLKDTYATLPTNGDAESAAEDDYRLESVPIGYYLIVDTTNGSGLENDAVSAYIVEVVQGKVTITPKADVPTLEKKVQEKNDSTGTTTGWQDAADYDIGDDVPFQLNATLPINSEDFAKYMTYQLVFHDDMSEGLKFNNDVSVTIGETTITSEDFGRYGIHVTTEGLEDGCEFEVTIDNVKVLPEVAAGKVVTVNFTAELTGDKVVIGSPGNPNTGYLEYSNNPNDEGLGKTTPDKVVVFTFETDVDKLDGENQPLEGAQFTLYKWVSGDGANELPEDMDDKAPTRVGGFEAPAEPGHWVEVGLFTPNEDGDHPGTSFSYEGLDSGYYKLVESTTPPGYNTIDPIDFTIKAEYDTADAADPKLNNLTTTPDSFKVENKDTGIVNTDIINQEGTQLPETGGIGTTIFYVVGSVLVLGAVILLVTKRRMKSE